MKKHIAEDLPARKFAPAAAARKDGKQDGKKKGGGTTPEERISQAASDIRYRHRREDIPLAQAYSQYMQHSDMSQVEKNAVREKLGGKDGAMKEDYQIGELAFDSIANAFHKVFVEGTKTDKLDELHLEELKAQLNSGADRKYKVRVTDKNGTSYVRYATREKINQLRANPNIKEVEMTQYGEPYEGEKNKGEQTARAKAGKSLDPVGKEDGDIDNDGDKDKTDDYLKNRRNVRGSEIAKRGKVAEEFLGEIKKIEKSKKNAKYDVMKGTNTSIISVMPKGIGEETELTEKKLTKKEEAKKEEIVQSLKPKYGKTSKTYGIATSIAKRVAEESSCEMGGNPKLKKGEGGEEDPRSIPTKMSLIKNNLRAMGVKNPVVMVASEEAGDGYIGPARLKIKNPLASDATRASSDKKREAAALSGKKPTEGGLLGRLQQRADAIDATQKMYNHYEPEGEIVSEEESDRQSDRARESGDWRSRSERPSPRRRRPSVADDPRFGSMSDAEWNRSSQNPANKRRGR